MTGFFGAQRGLWAKILLGLPEEEGIAFNEVLIDSTTMKVYRLEEDKNEHTNVLKNPG
jgi:hypothetical protein